MTETSIASDRVAGARSTPTGSVESIDDELAKLGAILVEERVLRRVIKGDRRLRGVGLQVPHEQCYALPRAELERHVERDELALELSALPERVIVIATPRAELASWTPEALSRVWRAVFHAKVHEAFDAHVASGRLGVAAIRERIHRIGQAEFDEIRSVLRQEDLLLPPIDDTSTYVEFVALYLELQQFSSTAIARTFPALGDLAKVDATIALDVDVAALLAASRPHQAPARPVTSQPDEDPQAKLRRTFEPILTERQRKKARSAALSARDRGNRARAAILHLRGGQPLAAQADLEELATRLSRALGRRLGDGTIEPVSTTGWAAALMPVALYAANQQRVSRFSIGARLLLDLQAACVIAERETKVVDPIEWMLSLGKRSIVRALPATREVRIAKHVHGAVAKLPGCGVPTAELATALHAMAGHADDNVRFALRPKIEAALDDVGLHPHSLPERVGEKKLVDELLDRAVAIGRLSLGNLRDAISKNDLKTSDLKLAELKTGDQLLRSDKILSRSLDGVYRRGEVYMRFLQKLSSLLFGTAIGRFLTLYFMLPLLGSFAIVEGLQHMVGPLWHKLAGVEPEIATRTTLLGGAAFLFLLMHVALFRRGMLWVTIQLGKLLRLVLWRIPARLWRHPVIARALDSKVFRWGIRPAIPAAIVWLCVPARFAVWPIGQLYRPIAAVAYLIAMFVMNSRWGRIAEERLTDAVVRSSRQVTTRIIPGLIKYTLDLFAELVEVFERGIYRVDEWLRFRSGQSVVIVAAKGVLATVWFVVTYFLRLYVNLFVEPTINPIKHFPVVTVAAKLIIPIIPSLLSATSSWTRPLLGPTFAGGFAAFTVLVLPGLAGFLVWELKENWRLYRATRPKTLRPIAIGHHGESMVALLKPGFHSGTIPKLYTKLRRAAWKADERGVAKQKEGLHHVEEAIHLFVDRQLVSMLNEVGAFAATDVAVDHIDVGSNRVHLRLACPSLVADAHVVIRFEQQSGWIVVSIPEPAWIDRLDEHQRQIFEIALSGFYKLAGVDIVREQIEDVLRGHAAAAPPYDIADVGLLVWPGSSYDTEIRYDLRTNKLTPTLRGEHYDGGLPDLAAHHALFRREPLYWSVWSTAWQQIARGEPPMPLLVGPSLLPRPRVEPVAAPAVAPAAAVSAGYRT
ncbi:MAG TPA: hypothetical protein VFQ53_07750 [Kofleriaceae bacterium]|nr:hypothetical protein [Kofleriaceae bacterium]